MNSKVYYVYKKKQSQKNKTNEGKNDNTDTLISDLEKLIDLPREIDEQSTTTVDSMKVEVDRTLAELDSIEKSLNL